MGRRAPSGTKGLIKQHHGCAKGRPPTSCDCAWMGRYRQQRVVLSKWARCKIDPRTKTTAIKVLNRFFAAVDGQTFDPAGERPALGTAETLSRFLTEWQTHYADAQGLTQNSLASMLNVLSRSALGGHSLEYLAGNAQEIERWLNATAKTRRWSNKTWNEYRGLLLRVLKQATVWTVNGTPRLAMNPVAGITARVALAPEHFTQRHLVEDVEDRLFDVVEQLNRPRLATHAKLTPETADAIRAGRAAGQSGKALAATYGVSPAVISAVWHGEIWNPNRQSSTRGTEMRRRLVAAFDGGLRAGEMMRIQLSHVNWRTVLLTPQDGPAIEAYEIRLPPAITKGGKTTGRWETVYAATARFRQVLEARRFALERNAPAEQFIFGREDGAFQQGFQKTWRELFTLAGLDYGRAKGLVWHTIRHEFISRLAELTKDPVLTQELARHRRLETTQRYFHTRRDRQIAAAASLDRKR
jgi:hypothetical protein